MRVEHLGFAPDYVDYLQAWDHQRAVHAQVADGTLPDTLLLLEHAATYTAGKRTEPHERPIDGTPAVDVVAHVRRLEQAMIDTCADFGVAAGRVEHRSGVWIDADERGPQRKIGAIGIRVSREVTMHGFALNADCDLSWGQVIVPCGIADAGITNLTFEVGRRVTVADILPVASGHLQRILDAAAVRSPEAVAVEA